ncbi:S8 family peptidase [Ferdinandcohnia sp. SAFN-114]|uniref:S8 family peptidase n=1 Tax=Ferdinandcohnia sp. SAFN-114 TaxID=3387275 RepID=UPI003F7EE442
MSRETKRVIIGCKKGYKGIRQFIHNCHINASIVQMDDHLNICVCTVSEEQISSFKSYFSSNPNVRFVEEDQIRKVNVIPNDPLFPEQWGISKVRGTRAWNRAVISPPSVPIAILDTGIDQNHEDLSSRIVDNQNFTDSPTVDDLYGHGTHVAGIAAAITDNLIGVAGMGFNSPQLLNIKVLNDQGVGFDSWIAQGIVYATNQGAKVINMSFGGPGASQTLREGILFARDKGVVVIASAGNENTDTRNFPAAYNYSISVAATDQNDQKANFSNFGASWVDVAAPGVTIISTCPNHPNEIECTNYGSLSGTSMSAPFVSGLASLLIATNPALTQGQIKKAIQKTAEEIDGTGVLYQYGRIDALKAITRAKN